VVGSFAGSTDYTAVQSAPVTFTIVAADKLAFFIQPHNSAAGELGPVVVLIENSQGQLVTSDNSIVTLSVATGPGMLGGTVSVKAFHGVAIFDHLLLATAGSYTLKAADGSDAAAISHAFNITPAQPRKLVFVQQPGNANAGEPTGPIVVDVEDQFGNLETGFDSSIALLLENDSHYGSSFELTKVRAVNGVATFAGISIDVPGTFRLLASAGPFVVGTSNSFTISPVSSNRQQK
jgi:hypothetical protein